jgi:hypothetical protein
LLQQKLLGPIAVCPEGQLEFEHDPLSASSPGAQHLPPTWTFGREHVGTQLLSRTRRN